MTTARSHIPNRVNSDGSCCVECARHGVLPARVSQEGRSYHSCKYWNHTTKQFTFIPSVHPRERCTVQFVFCDEHAATSRPAASTSSHDTSRRIETLAIRDTVNDDDDDPMNEENEVLLSHFLTPASQAEQPSLSLSQQQLIARFEQLMDELYN
jgi:hypothetical protein